MLAVGTAGAYFFGADFSIMLLMAFFAIMIALFVAFLSLRVWAFWRRTCQLRALTVHLNGLSSPTNWSEVRKVVSATPWLYNEFDEFLEQCWSFEGQLYNAEQAGQYFTSANVEPERHAWMDVVPSSLTGLGILGTFVGIVFGLGPMSTALQQGGSVELGGAAGQLVSGLFVSFFTSILGLLLSLVAGAVYTSSENSLDSARLAFVSWMNSKVQRGVSPELLMQSLDLQRRSLSAESIWQRSVESRLGEQVSVVRSMLQHLSKWHAEDIAQCKETHRLLAEQIEVQKAQTAELQHLGQSIGEALEGAIHKSGLVSAVQGMSQTIASSQTEGMGQMLETFNAQLADSFGDNFRDLGASMNQMVTANSSYQENMTSLVSGLGDGIDKQIQASETVERVIVQAAAAVQSIEAVAATLDAGANRIAAASQDMNQAIEGQRDALAQQRLVNHEVVEAVREQTLGWRSHQQAIEGAYAGIEDRFGGLQAAVDALRDWHDRIRNQLGDQLQTWLDAIVKQESLTLVIGEERQGWKGLVDSLGQSSGELERAALTLSKAGSSLEGQLSGIVSAREQGEQRLAEAIATLQELNRAQSDAATAQRTLGAELLQTVQATTAGWSGHQQAVTQAYADIEGRMAQVGTAVDGLVRWHDQVRDGLGGQVEAWREAVGVQAAVTQDMKEERATWRALMQELKSAQAGFVQLGKGLQGLTERLSSEVGSLRQTQDAGQAGLSQVGSELKELGASLGDSWKDYAEVAKQLSTSLPDVQSLLEGLTGAVSAQKRLVADAQGVADAFRETGTVQRELKDGLGKLAEAAEATRGAMEPAAGSFHRSAAALEQATAALSSADKQTQEVSTALVRAVTQLQRSDAEARKTWEGVTGGLSRGADTFTRSMTEFESKVGATVTSTFKDFDSEVAGVVKQLTGAVSALHGLVERIESVVEEMGAA